MKSSRSDGGQIGARSGGGWLGSLVWAYVLMISAGFCALRMPFSTTRGNELTVDRAIFSTINAATLTGFQQAHDIDTYKLPGQVTIFLLTVGGTLFALIAGGLALARIMRLPYTDEQIITTSIVLELIVLLIGWFCSLLPGMSAFFSIFDTSSAFGNSGVWLGGSIRSNQPFLHLVLLPLTIVGALSVPVLLDLWDCFRKKRAMARHTSLTVGSFALLYLLGLVALLLIDWWTESPVNFARASAVSINARGAGLPINASFAISRVTTWFLLLLMIIGGNSASATGGLKATTVIRFFQGLWDSLRGRTPGRGFGIALVWILGYFLAISVAMFVLLNSEPDQPMDRLLFLAVSAMSNVGLSHEPVAIVGIGMHTLSTLMLIGRIAPIFLLWWAAKTTDETIGIG